MHAAHAQRAGPAGRRPPQPLQQGRLCRASCPSSKGRGLAAQPPQPPPPLRSHRRLGALGPQLVAPVRGGARRRGAHDALGDGADGRLGRRGGDGALAWRRLGAARGGGRGLFGKACGPGEERRCGGADTGARAGLPVSTLAEGMAGRRQASRGRAPKPMAAGNGSPSPSQKQPALAREGQSGRRTKEIPHASMSRMQAASTLCRMGRASSAPTYLVSVT
jgi:hypothetical protein